MDHCMYIHIVESGKKNWIELNINTDHVHDVDFYY